MLLNIPNEREAKLSLFKKRRNKIKQKNNKKFEDKLRRSRESGGEN